MGQNHGRMAGRRLKEAIAEALQLARRTFEDHAAEYKQERQPA